MAKRGYKLQEFVAHAGNVNCLSFGKKNCRVFITGGDDQKVNLWSVGKPTSLMSLCGHTSPIESAAFDSAEVLVVAGSSSGAIKLWDLEETKMVRTLTGHRSYCTAVEFHPFGEFFASGSMDTNLKIWDIRKKGCIHTYKGHTRGISTIRFTPDGRWVVSGGFDNVVKVWDLTAGKLLHDFKFHEGHIRSIEFHPLEFLLATGSADKTVKFWDLETFEMIESARREAAGVRSITFHPDGRTLFCGLDDSLKVYSWEPVICHDSVDMGWSTLGDLCIQDGKLLGGAYYENSVAVWVADISLVEPYGTRSAPKQHSHCEQKSASQGNILEKEETHAKTKPNQWSTIPDSESKEIKTIYVDRVSSITSKSVDPIDVPKVLQPYDSNEISAIGIQKHGPVSSFPPSDSKEISTVEIQKHSPVSRLPPSGSKEISTVGILKHSPVSSLSPSDSKENSTIRIQKHGPVSSLPPSDSEEISTFGVQKNGPVSSLPPSDSKEIITVGILKHTPVSSLPPSDSEENSTMGIQKHGPVSSLPPSDSKEISTFGVQKNGPVSSLPPSDSKEISTVGVQKNGPVSSLPPSDSKENSTIGILKHSPVSSLPPSDSKEISTFGVQKNGPVSSLPPSNSKEISMVGIPKHGPVSSLPPSDSKEISPVGIPKHGPMSSLPPSNSKEIDSIGIQKRAPVASLPPSDSKEGGSIGIQKRGPVASPPSSDSKDVRTTVIQKRSPVASPPPSDSKDVRTTGIQKRGPATSLPRKANRSAVNRSLVMPSIVPREGHDGKELVGSRRQSIATAKPSSSMNTKPPSRRRLSASRFDMERMSVSLESLPSDDMENPMVGKKDSNICDRLVADENAKESSEEKKSDIKTVAEKFDRNSLPATTSSDQSLSSRDGMNSVKFVNGVAVVHGRTRSLVERFERKDKFDVVEICIPERASGVVSEPVETPPSQKSDQPIVLREQSALDDDVIDYLMQSHEVLSSTFRSRLTKLQVVRHFWERNNVKGAINAVKKLPDHSVQADVVSALIERIEVFTLDLFSSLLPVLSGLLDSKIERHVSISLEVLLKLVAVFGTVVSSAVSAPPSVGVNLQAEERIECCKQCSAHLQNIHRNLPELVKRGGVVARCAQQLNLVLQQT